HIEEGKAPYNIPLGFRIGGVLDEERLLTALEMMMTRYEILRTSFEATAGEPCMVISPAGTIRPPVFKTHLQSDEELSHYAMEEAVTPFDLQQSPLWRLRLLYLSNEVVAGVLTFHHIIADGWSVNVFTRSLLQLYHDLSTPLPSLPLQYKDYAVWMASLMSSDHMAAAAGYWQQQFASPVVRLELPSDYPRHGRRTSSGSGLYVELPQGLTQQLQRFSRQEQCTPFGVLLA
ncbi:condensation domain-containing protein, partial [Chitinophaga qingshengii]